MSAWSPVEGQVLLTDEASKRLLLNTSILGIGLMITQALAANGEPFSLFRELESKTLY